MIRPMKKLSIKGRITLWYAFLFIAICLASIWLLWTAANRAVTR